MEENTLLRIDLTKQEHKVEDIQPPITTWIGGKGYGTHFLLNEVPPRCDPLGPENKLVFACGPLTGTSFPTGNRYGLFFKSPLTGTFAESYSGGDLGRRIRGTGYIAVIIQGVAGTPSYIHVTEDQVKIHDASWLWGKGTFTTRAALLERHGPKCEVALIGPAGERLVRFASVQNNESRSAGRCGPGAVMGSKNIKAIVFEGTKRPALNDDPEFKDIVKEALERLRKNPLVYGKEGMYRKFGTPIIVDWTNELGCFPTRYYSQGFSETSHQISAHALNETILKKRTGCWNCPYTCGKYVEVEDGPFKCKIEGPEYETIANFGGLCDIQDIRAIAKINEFCDDAGIDTISAGSICGLAIEAKRRGMVKELDAIPLDYNDPLSVLAFLDDMVNLKGIEKEFSMGTKHVARKYSLESIAMHVKGLEFAGYDPRAFRGFALSYGVAPEGPTHLRSVYHGIERELPPSYENRVLPMIEQEDKMAIIDSLIVCKFVRGILDWDFLARLCTVSSGVTLTTEALRGIAAKVVTGSRIFNVKAGFTREDDYMPERVYREKLPRKAGPPHELDKEKYGQMLDEYYAARGWSKDGIPRDEE